MRIGIITNLYPPYARGGAEQVVVRTVEELLTQGHDVFVVSSQPKNQGSGIVSDHTTTERVYRFFPKNVYYILNDFKHRWIYRLIWHIVDALCPCGARRVSEVLQEESPDVFITHNLKGIGLSIPRVIQASRTPHIHIVHDLQLVYPSGLLFFGQEEIPWYRAIFYQLYQKVCRFQLGQPNLVIFPSTYLKDQYLKLGFFKKSKVIVMPNPAPNFLPVVRENKNDSILRLLFVGQLEDHKGIKFLLDAFRDIDVQTQLIIAGEGGRSGLVERLAGQDKRITYLGFVSLEQLLNCFSIVDALVVPSLCYENSPTVIYESLQAGVPVLASDIGGVGELVENEKNGYLFRPGSKEDFLRVVKKLVQNSDRFDSSRDQIRGTVAPYALEKYTKELIEKCQLLIDEKRKQ
ncbi:MAG: glycosyltransferase [Patescibacteria group bacterium]